MADRFRLTLAQLNATVGDIDGNAAWRGMHGQEGPRGGGRDGGAARDVPDRLQHAGSGAETCVSSGAAIARIEQLAEDCADGPALAIGGPGTEWGRSCTTPITSGRGWSWPRCEASPAERDRLRRGAHLFGAAWAAPMWWGRCASASPICEDSWHADVAETLAETGAELLLVPNGSPYYRGKMETRQNLMVARVIETGLPLIYLNLVGGQDDQVFDGGTFVLNPGGELACKCR